MPPVRRLTFQQAIDYFHSLESDDDSDVDGDQHVRRSITPRGDDFADRDLSALSDGEVVVEDGDSDDESDSEDSDHEFNDDANEHLVSPNNLRWQKTRPPSRLLSRNIIRFRPGPTFVPRSELEAFCLFLDEGMLHIILECTNRKLRNAGKPILTISELKAGIGILIRAGADKDNLSDISTLFNPSDSRPFYRCVLSKNRFKEFVRYLSFDYREDRRQRQETDKMAAVREIWDLFQNNLRKYYVPSDKITVDEQLYGYRGYAPGRCYMKSKPAKYGVKFYWLCDAENGYALAGNIYCGRAQDSPRESGVAEKTVLSLTSFYNSSGRSVFIDRYFTSHSLCVKLLQNGLTMIGTVMSNRRDVPKPLKTVKDREMYSTIEVWDSEHRIMLISYVPKKGRNVLLMTSAHSSAEIQNARDDKKPLVIHEYNQGKGGVDLLDSCIDDFSTKRKTNRYPLLIFFNILDICVFNAFLIAKESNSMATSRCRRRFMKELAFALAKDNMEERMKNEKVYSQTKDSFNRFGFVKPEELMQPSLSLPETSNKPKQCSFCRRTTRSSCDICNKRVCTLHKSKSIRCQKCTEMTL